MIFTIKGELTDYNTYSNAQRFNRFAGAKIKADMTEYVRMQVLRIPKIKTPAYFTFNWFCKNEKKDPDNIASSKKFIFDGLMKAGKLENDGWKQVAGFSDQFFLNKKNPRIEVEISE